MTRAGATLPASTPKNSWRPGQVEERRGGRSPAGFSRRAPGSAKEGRRLTPGTADRFRLSGAVPPRQPAPPASARFCATAALLGAATGRPRGFLGGFVLHCGVSAATRGWGVGAASVGQGARRPWAGRSCPMAGHVPRNAANYPGGGGSRLLSSWASPTTNRQASMIVMYEGDAGRARADPAPSRIPETRPFRACARTHGVPL